MLRESRALPWEAMFRLSDFAFYSTDEFIALVAMSGSTALLLLLRDGGTAAAQHELLNFSRRGFRQLCQKRHGMRRFEMREPLARKRAQLRFLHRCARLEHDEGMRRFSPLRVGHPHDCGFLYGGMAQQHTFDFNR